MLLSTNELLWLPRSPDPRPAMGRAEKATRTSPVSEQVRLRCFCAHFLHSNRAVALLMPKIRLPQAAEGLLIPSFLFGPGRAETKRPSFLSLRSFCLFALPSQQQHQISSNCRQRQSESNYAILEDDEEEEEQLAMGAQAAVAAADGDQGGGGAGGGEDVDEPARKRMRAAEE